MSTANAEPTPSVHRRAHRPGALQKGTVYLGDNGRLVCARCAGGNASRSGRDRSGYRLIPVGGPELRDMNRAELTCKCGAATATTHRRTTA